MVSRKYFCLFMSTNILETSRSNGVISFVLITQRLHLLCIYFRIAAKMDTVEYRAVIKFLTKKGLSSNQILQELQGVYHDEAPSRRTVERWHHEFLHGRISLHDDKHPGRPTSSTSGDNVDAVHRLVLEDPRVRVKVIAETLHISAGSVHSILHDHLQLSKVSARWVPKCLTIFDKQRRVACSRELLHRYERDPCDFEARIITADETWVYDYQPESKQQSKVWVRRGSAPPVKFKATRSTGKTLLTVYWDCQGIVMVDYLQRGRTMTGEYYAELLRRLREAVKVERRGKLSRGVLLQHDNAAPHNAHVSTTAAHDCGYECLPHPPYSPDLAPSDFHLFANLKKSLGGSRFVDEKEMKDFVNDWFREQSKDFYLQGIRALSKRWQKCIDLHGDYVEKK